MAQLSDQIHEQIELLSADGDEYAEEGEYAAALARYRAAWELLPEPRTRWEAATWLLAAMGDANFLAGDFEASREDLARAMHCPDAIGNPFLHLRLGQSQFELGNADAAADELARAWMGDPEIFDEEDPKYLGFLRTRMQGI